MVTGPRLLSAVLAVCVAATGFAGEVGPNDFRISFVGTNGQTQPSGRAPVPAYNAARNEFLVIFYADPSGVGESEIYGQRINASTGALIGSSFRISDMGPDGNSAYKVSNACVVYNPNVNEYLVVWRGDDNINGLVDDEFEIFGQRLSSTGAEIGTNDFRISNMGTNGDTAAVGDVPWVAHNTTNNEYLVVWRGHNGSGEFEIWGQRLSGVTGGETGGGDFRISDAGPDGDLTRFALEPSVAYNSTNNEYLVAWQADEFVDNETDIYGQRINAATGAEVGTNDFRISDMGPNGDTNYIGQAPAIAYNSYSNEYLVVFYGVDPVFAGAQVYGQRLNAATGAEVGTNDFLISDVGPGVGMSLYNANYPAVAFSRAARQYVVVWPSDNDDPSTVDNEFEIWGQLISIDGAQVGVNDFRVSDMGPDGNTAYGAGEPEVAIAANGRALIVWRGDDNTAPLVDDETEVFGQLYQLTAVPLEMHGDYNADGRDDIVLRHNGTGDVAIWIMNGSTITTSGFPGSTGTNQIAGIGDFNGDGKSDLLLRDSLGTLGIWFLNGGALAGGGLVGSPGDYSVAAVADFSGDGKADILLSDALGNLGMWIMNGTTISSGGLVGSPGAYMVAGVGDFNGDFRADILLQDALGALGLWLMNGSAIAGGGFVGSPGAYSVVGTKDFDGNGRADILLRDSLGNLGMWLMSSSSIVGGGFVGSPGAYSVTSVGDYDGNARADILLRDTLSNVGVWFMNGSTLVGGGAVGAASGYSVY